MHVFCATQGNIFNNEDILKAPRVLFQYTLPFYHSYRGGHCCSSYCFQHFVNREHLEQKLRDSCIFSFIHVLVAKSTFVVANIKCQFDRMSSGDDGDQKFNQWIQKKEVYNTSKELQERWCCKLNIFPRCQRPLAIVTETSPEVDIK